VVAGQGRGNQQKAVAYPGILFGRGSTNSVEDRGERTGIWGAAAHSYGFWRQP